MIYESQEVVLQGKRQTILLEGKSADAPVMIMFHGGPWGSVIYGEAYRGYYPELSAKYILVWWDQYGCGKNYVKNPEGLVVEDFAKMAVDLVDAVRKMYPDHRNMAGNVKRNGGICGLIFPSPYFFLYPQSQYGPPDASVYSRTNSVVPPASDIV
ncbi:MAG: hypothetical protein NC313_12260 [Butyrivibrio sp.]|nr:hypothetical protein [Butyrivibrio sp.]